MGLHAKTIEIAWAKQFNIMDNLKEEILNLRKQYKTYLFVIVILALSVTLLLLPTIFEKMKYPSRDLTWIQYLDFLSIGLSFLLMIYLGKTVLSLKKKYRFLEKEYEETITKESE
jgi:FtsH-binding integral membrane protein